MAGWVIVGEVVVSVTSAAAYGEHLEDHVIAMNKFGRPIDPKTKAEIENFDAYINNIVDRAREWCQDKTKNGRVMIHVHGGMNTSEKSRDNAKRLAGEILKETGDDKYYPIFITWPSGGVQSYWDYMWTLRRGRHAKVDVSRLLFFIIPVTDLLRGIARLLTNFWYQLANDLNTFIYAWWQKRMLRLWRSAEVCYQEALKPRDPPDPVDPSKPKYNVTQGVYRRTTWSKIGRALWYFVTIPGKILTQVVILDAAASGGWTVMLHRIRNLFRPCDEYEQTSEAAAAKRFKHHEPSGALVVFWTKLHDNLENNFPESCKITLVAHSMGAIVINQSVRYLREKSIDEIIYMAPACSTREMSDVLIPLMQRSPQIKLSILTLHPMFETEETHFFDIIPRGSLLEWIDNWYTNPAGHTHRRAGKFVNLLPALHLFHDVRDRLFIKAFDARRGSMPRQHGDFGKCKFWRREFRDLKGPMSFLRPMPRWQCFLAWMWR